MKVLVRFFAILRERSGTSEVEIDLSPGATTTDLLAKLRHLYPSLPSSDSLLIAVNYQYVDPHNPLREGDEVAFIPPVSGGQT